MLWQYCFLYQNHFAVRPYAEFCPINRTNTLSAQHPIGRVLGALQASFYESFGSASPGSNQSVSFSFEGNVEYSFVWRQFRKMSSFSV